MGMPNCGRQSYSKESRVQFFGPPCISFISGLLYWKKCLLSGNVLLTYCRSSLDVVMPMTFFFLCVLWFFTPPGVYPPHLDGQHPQNTDSNRHPSGGVMPPYHVSPGFRFEIHSFPRSWDNRGYPKKLGSHWIGPRSIFSNIFHGLLFGWTPWMYWLNLKSVAFPVPEIIGGTQKICGVSGYAHASFSPKFFMGFYSDGPPECTG